MKKVYVHILTWNDQRFLPDLFESIEKQTFQDFAVRILDNGSNDGTVKYLQQYYPHTLVARNLKNSGFAGGHNQLFKYTFEHLKEGEDPYILVANSDMVFDQDLIKNMVRVLDENPNISAVQPKIYRAFIENAGQEVLEDTVMSDVLDTTGLSVKKGWRMTDRGAGELDKLQHDEKKDIFGVTGTLSMFRWSSLMNNFVNGEIYDSSFFAYKEDCDLAWRFQKTGSKVIYEPKAKAWHYRGMYGDERLSFFARLKNRKSQSNFFSALSTRNQILMLMKNITLGDLVRYFPWLLVENGSRVFYGFLFEKETRKRLFQIFGLLKDVLDKRKIVNDITTVENKKIRKYVE